MKPSKLAAKSVVQIEHNLGIIQFQDIKLQLITTPISGLTLRRGKDDYHAYYGMKGSSELTEDTFDDIHTMIGLSVPPRPTSKADDDSDDSDDADFVSP